MLLAAGSRPLLLFLLLLFFARTIVVVVVVIVVSKCALSHAIFSCDLDRDRCNAILIQLVLVTTLAASSSHAIVILIVNTILLVSIINFTQAISRPFTNSVLANTVPLVPIITSTGWGKHPHYHRIYR